jgi:hypothetical protein
LREKIKPFLPGFILGPHPNWPSSAGVAVSVTRRFALNSRRDQTAPHRTGWWIGGQAGSCGRVCRRAHSGSYLVGVVRHPNVSSTSRLVRYVVSRGRRWSGDGGGRSAGPTRKPEEPSFNYDHRSACTPCPDRGVHHGPTRAVQRALAWLLVQNSAFFRVRQHTS